MEPLTGGDFVGLLIDGNAQGFIDGIAVLVEKSGERIPDGNVLHPLCHAESFIEPRGSHTSRRRNRLSRSPPWLRRGFWWRELRLSCVLRALRALIAPASRKSQHRWPGIDGKHTAATQRC